MHLNPQLWILNFIQDLKIYFAHALSPKLFRSLTNASPSLFPTLLGWTYYFLLNDYLVTEQPLKETRKSSDPLLWNTTSSFCCLQFLASYSFEFQKLGGIFASLAYFLLRAPECPNSLNYFTGGGHFVSSPQLRHVSISSCWSASSTRISPLCLLHLL